MINYPAKYTKIDSGYMEIPIGNALIEQLPVEVEHVSKTA